ncbi:hypothetical protein C2E20_8774 [Micractinium conductrix]|uniref:Uncharacterized protein n=1 Tax=Micractinium conductrix TaxID=554055 RepID=A0A2P6V0D1_9CHLO|nr:hypothetical protein C2E20_8774 [Micractinium conductrix]|eukprot:PSC67558.1 hypothetical protein C2E20_8774 [Micractinium conductrix]
MIICLGPVCVPVHLLLAFLVGLAHQHGYLKWFKREWVMWSFWKQQLGLGKRPDAAAAAAPPAAQRSAGEEPDGSNCGRSEEPAAAAAGAAAAATPGKAGDGAAGLRSRAATRSNAA